MVKKKVKKTIGSKFVPYKKTDVLKQCTGFRIEADEHSTLGSAIEFVIDPPVGGDRPRPAL